MKRLLIIVAVCALPVGIAWAGGFMPWADVVKMADLDQDRKLSAAEILNFPHHEHFQGFQPFMANHFQKYDFNQDGFLSFEECRKGMKMDGYSEEQMVAEFKRDHGFRPWKKK
jgi:hypothetical protein